MPATPFAPDGHAAAGLTQAALAMLARCHKRPTLLRIHLLESLLALDADKGGATVDELYLHLQQRRAQISVPSIYKVLAELVAAHAVDRHAAEQAPTVFVIRRAERMTHLVCSSCQAVQSLDASALRQRLLAAAGAEGFEVDDVLFTVRGRCSACAARPRAGAARPADPGQPGAGRPLR
ncbi:Fur family transcriptional regulator [Pseudorhodoferax sp.]|uniref:Fur family transcriptional regulator n=1 Tax=Pseudorhodoferax sp. TaxID=1993553 RepID=UPI002DD6437D|nr:transcriptional repressor [Pseudorhodoferax sp.]